ncbi:MAG TPA: hypothetical protein VFE36_14290 [Candidatus Baltobacteraceae bacterium]|nr:hypothetical protein [Candidatus Baltobacteraceae bacterium]
MKRLLNATALAGAVIFVSSVAAAAADSAPAMPDGAMGATFNYTIAVQTSQGKKSSSGKIVVKPAGEGKLALTVTSSDGTSKTIPLTVANGTVTPDMPAPAASVPPAAQTLMANLKLAATVGVAAKKSGGKGFSSPIVLTPVGDGTPVPSQISMNPAASPGSVTYSGSVNGSTMTVLPPSGGLNPEDLAKNAGVGMVAHASLAAAIAMHHREKVVKNAAKSAVADAMSLTIHATFNGGKFHDINGAQTDAVNLAGKEVKVYSTWSFVRVAP